MLQLAWRNVEFKGLIEENELWGSMGAGVGAADTVPLRDLEVPGLVPDTGGVELNTKQARRLLYQRGWRGGGS